jgi:hypothetical protein
MAIERPWPPLAIITGVTNPDLVLLVTRLYPGNADPEALPPIFLKTREAEPVDIGSQALAWEPVEKNILLLVFPKTFAAIS